MKNLIKSLGITFSERERERERPIVKIFKSLKMFSSCIGIMAQVYSFSSASSEHFCRYT